MPSARRRRHFTARRAHKHQIRAHGVRTAQESQSPYRSLCLSLKAPPEPEPGRRTARTALVVVDGTHPSVILAELKEIYHRAGLPVPPKHEQLAVQYLLDIPSEKRHRVADYVKHCLLSGKWRGATTTKSLLNLLRDGDWDVPIVERELPPAPARAREPSRREANLSVALEIYKREKGEA